MHSRDERIGELMLIVACIVEGLFPIIAKFATNAFPPILFTSVSVLCASLIFLVIMIITGRIKQKLSLAALGNALGVAVFIVLSLGLVLFGVQYTSSINTALLLQTEILFAFAFTTIFLGEKLKVIQLLGTIAILLGTIFVVFNGVFELNRGDILIVLATVFFPIGNTFAKRALKLMTSEMLLFLRYFIGGLILLVISYLFEDISGVNLATWQDSIWILIVYVSVSLSFGKFLWYTGLRRLPVGKATYIISANPAFSLIFALILLHEVPTINQAVGFVLTLSGVYMLINKGKQRGQLPDPV